MKWISAQPATLYYAWQVEVYINNFVENGILPNDIHVLFSVDGEIPEKLRFYKEIIHILVFTFMMIHA